ncbi:hypothetical protein ARMSODRAFT_678541 [Armillaria solidipes]|uniref:Uncharacterized protein n=1 Tax=Armillaria solidipes TaxID=1076256 RepID=A0A2H3B1U6_9AGAR|nr:hypothetical protein ARMSODRAFT_678541 [Armillaria solidipes]
MTTTSSTEHLHHTSPLRIQTPAWLPRPRRCERRRRPRCGAWRAEPGRIAALGIWDSEPLPSTLPRVRATDLPIRRVLAATTTFSISTQSKRSLLAAKAGNMGPSSPLTFKLNHD